MVQIVLRPQRGSRVSRIVRHYAVRHYALIGCVVGHASQTLIDRPRNDRGITALAGLRSVQCLSKATDPVVGIAQSLEKARASRIMTTPRLPPGASAAVDLKPFEQTFLRPAVFGSPSRDEPTLELSRRAPKRSPEPRATPAGLGLPTVNPPTAARRRPHIIP